MSTRELSEKLRQVSCTEVAYRLGLKRGKNRRWHCPQCNNADTATPDLSTDKGTRFHCFGCEANGSAIDLYALHRGAYPIDRKDYAKAVADFAEYWGVKDGDDIPEEQMNALMASLGPPEHPKDGALEPTWKALCSRPSATAEAWLASRGIEGLPPGSFAELKTFVGKEWPTCEVTKEGKVVPFNAWLSTWLGGFLHANGTCIAAPIYSASDGAIGAIHVRPLVTTANSNAERRFVGGKIDSQGNPRGYGEVAKARNAKAVVLCEGMADTFAAIAMLKAGGASEDVAVVGACDAGGLKPWGQWLGAQAHIQEVRVVFQFDRKDPSNAGVGEENSWQAVDECGDKARMFAWNTFRKRLLKTHKVDLRPYLDKGSLDLANVTADAKAQGVSLQAIGEEFLTALLGET